MSLTGVQEANSQMAIYRNAHALVFLCIYFYLYSLFSNFRPIVQGNSDFEIQEIFACEIWNPGLWNREYSPRDPESHLRLESVNPSSTDKEFGIQYSCNPDHDRIWNQYPASVEG